MNTLNCESFSRAASGLSSIVVFAEMRIGSTEQPDLLCAIVFTQSLSAEEFSQGEEREGREKSRAGV